MDRIGLHRTGKIYIDEFEAMGEVIYSQTAAREGERIKLYRIFTHSASALLKKINS